jgi:hypothetical protein
MPSGAWVGPEAKAKCYQGWKTKATAFFFAGSLVIAATCPWPFAKHIPACAQNMQAVTNLLSKKKKAPSKTSSKL